MIAYVDASVLLRQILREPHTLPEWDSIEIGVASAILEVECLRAIDRLRITENLTDEQVSERREALYGFLPRMQFVELDRALLSRAAQPFSTVLGTLDAIHLASALVWRDQAEAELTMATHDASLGRAARAHGMRVIGV